MRGCLLSVVMVLLLMGSCTVGCLGRGAEYPQRCRANGGTPGYMACHMPRLTVAPPEGWVFRTAAEMRPGRDGDQAWREALDHYQRLAVAADFDGDGREDQAAILLDETFETFAVFAIPADGEAVRVTRPQPVAALPGRALAVREDGRRGQPALLVKAPDGEDEAFAWDGASFVRAGQ
ncbi:MAG: hypothetical protein V7702_09920 [Phenylobacterium sp.]